MAEYEVDVDDEVYRRRSKTSNMESGRRKNITVAVRMIKDECDDDD